MGPMNLAFLVVADSREAFSAATSACSDLVFSISVLAASSSNSCCVRGRVSWEARNRRFGFACEFSAMVLLERVQGCSTPRAAHLTHTLTAICSCRCSSANSMRNRVVSRRVGA